MQRAKQGTDNEQWHRMGYNQGDIRGVSMRPAADIVYPRTPPRSGYQMVSAGGIGEY